MQLNRRELTIYLFEGYEIGKTLLDQLNICRKNKQQLSSIR